MNHIDLNFDELNVSYFCPQDGVSCFNSEEFFSKTRFWSQWHRPTSAWGKIPGPRFESLSEGDDFAALNENSGRSDGPDVDLFGDDAPVGVVVVRADDVQVVDVRVDEVVQLALPEHVVVAVVDQRAAAAVGVDRLGRTKQNRFQVFVTLNNSQDARPAQMGLHQL